MTAAEFFETLEAKLLDDSFWWWTDQWDRIIRVSSEAVYSDSDRKHLRRSRCYSPITAVCKVVTGRHFPIGQWRQAAEALRLNPRFANQLALAQDKPRREIYGRARQHRRRLVQLTKIFPPPLPF